jgi:hypothetical protein
VSPRQRKRGDGPSKSTGCVLYTQTLVWPWQVDRARRFVAGCLVDRGEQDQVPQILDILGIGPRPGVFIREA